MCLIHVVLNFEERIFLLENRVILPVEEIQFLNLVDVILLLIERLQKLAIIFFVNSAETFGLVQIAEI